ncbi:hypothetical protein FQN54_001953 [Arachnomyces sp. PD_36]|nr:hypothetical protein FQN54_001953 [Arachnomyces sp. PD_36]
MSAVLTLMTIREILSIWNLLYLARLEQRPSRSQTNTHYDPATDDEKAKKLSATPQVSPTALKLDIYRTEVLAHDKN